MRDFRLWFAALAICFSIQSTSTYADIVSTFDTDADGWSSVGNGAGGGVAFNSTAGNPGGAIQMTDVDNGFAYFQAPAKFLTSGLYSQTLSYDLSVSAVGDPIDSPVQVSLEGNGLVLLNGLADPTSSFLNYSFLLDETSGWRIVGSRNISYSLGIGSAPTMAQFQGVVDNLNGIFLSADHTNGTIATGTTEIQTLDNVRLTTVPEPNSAAFLTVALSIVGLVRRRRRCEQKF